MSLRREDSDDVTYYGAPGQSSWNDLPSTKLEEIQFEQSRKLANVWNDRSVPPICKLYPLGKCRFGLACRYRHEDSNVKILSSLDDFKKRVKERVESFSVTCNVCFENPLCRRRRFGMLTYVYFFSFKHTHTHYTHPPGYNIVRVIMYFV